MPCGTPVYCWQRLYGQTLWADTNVRSLPRCKRAEQRIRPGKQMRAELPGVGYNLQRSPRLKKVQCMVVKIDRPTDINIGLEKKAPSAGGLQQVESPADTTAQGIASAKTSRSRRAHSLPQSPTLDRLADSPPARGSNSVPNALLQAPRGAAAHGKELNIAQPAIVDIAPLSLHERLELAKPPMPLGSPLAGTREGVLTGLTPARTLLTVLNSGKYQWYTPQLGDQPRTVKFDKYVGEVYLSDRASETQRMRFSTIQAESGTTYCRGGTFITGSYGAQHIARELKTGDIVAGKLLHLENFDTGPKDRAGQKKLKYITFKEFNRERDMLHKVGLLLDEVHDGDKHTLITPYFPVDGLDIVNRIFNSIAIEDSGVPALKFLREGTEALARLHACGVASFDIKPENLMVDAEGRMHVVDLGFAQEIGANGLAKSHGSGTLGHVAPEVYFNNVEANHWMRKKGMNEKADVWGLATCIADILTDFQATVYFGGLDRANSGAQLPYDIASQNYRNFREFHADMQTIRGGLDPKKLVALQSEPQKPNTPGEIFQPFARAAGDLFETVVIKMMHPDFTKRISSKEAAALAASQPPVAAAPEDVNEWEDYMRGVWQQAINVVEPTQQVSIAGTAAYREAVLELQTDTARAHT
jgi:serine/threonine protein kinase